MRWSGNTASQTREARVKDGNPMKIRYGAIFLVSLLFLVLSYLIFDWKRVYAVARQDCYMTLGGARILLKGVTAKCFLQNNGPAWPWIFVSDTRIYMTICGSHHEDTPEWGYNFVHFVKGNPTPIIAPTWHDICSKSGMHGGDEVERAYARTVSKYAVVANPRSGGSFETLYGGSTEALHEVIRDFETADQISMPEEELDDLVHRYRFPENNP